MKKHGMKIAYVDIITSGHHISYIKGLIKNEDNNYILIVPEYIDEISKDKQRIITNVEGMHKNPILYLKWLKETYHIIKKENVDVIHFLYGDAFARYFGIGLRKFKKYKTIATYHQIRRNYIKDISFKFIMKRIDIGVVHTSSLYENLTELGIKNLKHIEYPCFSKFRNIDNFTAKRRLGLNENIKTIAFLGVITEYKGFDLLIDSLNKVNEEFQFIVAGKVTDSLSVEIVTQMVKSLNKKYFMKLGYVEDELFKLCELSADIIVLPYRKSFDGASGPLAEGVWLRKTIVGANHGSLGNIIKENNLGITFETENVEDLARAITKSLQGEFDWNEKTENYRKQLDPKTFLLKYKQIYNRL